MPMDMMNHLSLMVENLHYQIYSGWSGISQRSKEKGVSGTVVIKFCA